MNDNLQYNSYKQDTNNDVSDNDKLLAMILYLSSFLTTIIIPLIIWLAKKEKSKFIDFHGKEYFNFRISIIIYLVIFFLPYLFVNIMFDSPLLRLISAIPIIAVSICNIVFLIISAVKSYKGECFKIPIAIRFFNR